MTFSPLRGASTVTQLLLSDFYNRFPQMDFKLNCVEICDGTQEQPIWQRIKTMQQRTSPRNHSGRRIKLVLHTPNWENTGAQPIQVYWDVDKKVNVRVTPDASAIATSENHIKFTLSDTDDDDDTDDADEEAGAGLSELDTHQVAQDFLSLQLDTATELAQDAIRYVQHCMSGRTSTSLDLRPAEYLDSKHVQQSLSCLYLTKFGFMERDIETNVRSQLRKVLLSADVFSIVEAIEEINLTTPFLKLSISSHGTAWFGTQGMLSTVPKVTAWKGLSTAGTINMTRTIILGLLDTLIQELKNAQPREDAKLQKYTALLRCNVDEAFLHNGELIVAELENHIRKSTDEDQSLDPWSEPEHLYFENGIVIMCNEESMVTFTPYDTTAIVTRYLPYRYQTEGMSVQRNIWPELFPTPEIGRFVMQVLATGLFRSPVTDSNRSGAQYKTILILEVPDSPTGAALSRFLSHAFGPYLLDCVLSDGGTYHGIYPGYSVHDIQRIDKQLHHHYRFALTDLSADSLSDIPTPRFDIAQNLGASIPHILIGQRGISTNVNVASHEAPFVVGVSSLDQQHVQILEQSYTAFMSQAIECWQQDPNLPVSLLRQIPEQIKVQRAVHTWFSEKAIVFITEQLIRDEGHTLTHNILATAFKAYLLKGIQGIESKERKQYQMKVEHYQSVVHDNLLRICEASNTEQNGMEIWNGLRLLGPKERRPPYAHLLGSLREKYFEAIYQQHKKQHSEDSSMSRSSFFRWCKQNGKPTTIPDLD